MYMKSLEAKSLPDRIWKRTIGRDQLRNMAELPHATSGGPAVSLDDRDAGMRLKADQPVAVVKEEEKVAVKRKREDSEEGERQPKKQR